LPKHKWKMPQNAFSGFYCSCGFISYEPSWQKGVFDTNILMLSLSLRIDCSRVFCRIWSAFWLLGLFRIGHLICRMHGWSIWKASLITPNFSFIPSFTLWLTELWVDTLSHSLPILLCSTSIVFAMLARCISGSLALATFVVVMASSASNQSVLIESSACYYGNDYSDNPLNLWANYTASKDSGVCMVGNIVDILATCLRHWKPPTMVISYSHRFDVFWHTL